MAGNKIRDSDALEERIRQLEARVAALETLEEERRQRELEEDDDGRSVSVEGERFDYGMVSGQMGMARAPLYDDEVSDDDDDDEEQDEDEDEDDDKKQGKEFLSLAKKDQSNKVKQMLNKKHELIQTKNSDGDTALHLAARFGCEDTVKELVKYIIKKKKEKVKVISLSESNKVGDTPLHLVVKEGHCMIASYLIRKQPDAVFMFNQDGVSPLLMAVQGENSDFVDELLRELRGSDVSESMVEKLLVAQPPIVHEAVKARNIATLTVLLNHLPFLVKLKDKRGWTPLSYAAYKGYKEEVAYFLENFPKCAKECDNDGSFPIHKAVSGGHVTILREFISNCPDTIHQNTNKNQTILHVAALYARSKVLRYLRKEQAQYLAEKFNAEDDDGNTVQNLLKGHKV